MLQHGPCCPNQSRYIKYQFSYIYLSPSSRTRTTFFFFFDSAAKFHFSLHDLNVNSRDLSSFHSFQRISVKQLQIFSPLLAKSTLLSESTETQISPIFDECSIFLLQLYPLIGELIIRNRWFCNTNINVFPVFFSSDEISVNRMLPK